MTNCELREALSEIREIEVGNSGKGVCVNIPAIDKSILLVPERIAAHQFFVDPFGNQAVRMMLRGEQLHLLIISERDFVFEPDTSDPGLARVSGLKIEFNVTDMPPLIGYSEIAANLGMFSKVCDRANRVDHILGQMILFRYGINGAQRVGIDCPDLEKQWQRLFEDLESGQIHAVVRDVEKNQD